jgi:hypothetical protein
MRFAYVFGCACFAFASTVAAQNSVTIPLANVTQKCINASKKTVDFWVVSARIPAESKWLRETKGVGVRVDVTLTPSEGPKVSFPAAAVKAVQNVDGQIVRVPLKLHVLANQDLSDATTKIDTIDMSVPLTFIRRDGKSDAAKVFQALLDFTQSSGVIPPNPYAKGMELVGQLSKSINTAFAPDPNEVVDPNLPLAFSIARNDDACSPQDLHDQIGVSISDWSKGKEIDGYIAADNVDRYCFYKTGSNDDPNIGFAKREGTCPTTAPAQLALLKNPQFIWAAYAVCKKNVNCGNAKAPTTLAFELGKQVLQSGNTTFDLASARLGLQETQALSRKLSTATGAPMPNRSASLLEALAICRSVGIGEERCLDRAFSRDDM